MSAASRPLLCALLAMAWAATAGADPWLAPGDEGLRHDIQLLADAGILRGPVTTWPMSWPDIARDALASQDYDLDSATVDALLRVQHLARASAASGYSGLGIRLAGAHHPPELRAFGDTPRDEGEIALRASWLSEHLALNLQGAAVADPDDERELRPDGSYLGVNVGNFMVSAGWMERWWGPGWDNSLALSTNARPIPGITIERNYTDPFKTKLLSWIGPWRASIAVGEAETHDVALPKVRFLAIRTNFKPRSWLEIGLTRTAQWCGGDRPCDQSTFTDLLLGRDNQVDAGGAASIEQPGNQMAGYDMRVRSPWHKLHLAVYTQWIGEDEAGFLPARFIGLFGLETWFSTGFGSIRLRAEYADTACSFTRQAPQFNCAYRNSIYPQGYAYRGRIIGAAMDNDSRMVAVAGLMTRANGDVLGITVRTAKLNRDGAGAHAWSPGATLAVDNVELRYSRQLGAGRLGVGFGYQEPGLVGGSSSPIRGFATWQQGF